MTRAQVEYEKRKILEAATVSRLKKLAAETTTTICNWSHTGDLDEELAALIDPTSVDIYYAPPRRRRGK
jgi:hypothetical protein